MVGVPTKSMQPLHTLTFFDIGMEMVPAGCKNRGDNGVKFEASITLHSSHDLQTNSEICVK